MGPLARTGRAEVPTVSAPRTALYVVGASALLLLSISLGLGGVDGVQEARPPTSILRQLEDAD